MAKMNSKFPGTCTACGCKFAAGTEIDYVRGVGARHYTVNQCAVAKKERWAKEHPVDAPVINLKPIVEFLQRAKDRGLKRPKLRVLDVDGKTELKIGLTISGQAPGSISVVRDLEGFIGCVRPDGRTTSKLVSDPARQAHLLNIAKDPARAAKEYAALMCRYSFCGLQLTDAGSVEVGYGPVCAKHWGLKHEPQGVRVLTSVPSLEVQP